MAAIWRDRQNVKKKNDMQLSNEFNTAINDLFISYSDDGNENEVAIVFIHGFPLNKSMWDNQRKYFRGRYRVITYDVRGYGDSEAGVEELSIDLFVADLRRLLDLLNLDKVILCGLSMGGYIALRAVEKFPALFDALILCDTQCSADTEDAREKRMKSINVIKNDGLELYADQMLSGFFLNSKVGKKSKEIIEVRRMIEGSSSEVVCNTLLALADRSETCSDLEKIEIPVLILVGKEDKITPPSAAEFMHSKIVGSTFFQVDDSAHLSNIENPLEFNQRIEDFLELITQKKL